MAHQVRRPGFTVVEVLVVLVIVGLMVGLLIPAVQTVRESARRLQCVNNLKQIGVGFHAYAAEHARFPGGTPGPWTVAILNEIGFSDAARLVTPGNASAASTVTAGRIGISVFLCPTEPRVVYDDGQMACNVIANGMAQNLSLAEFTDGLSGTALVTDNKSLNGLLWPAGPAGDVGALEGSSHTDFRPLLMGDGRVLLLKRKVADPIRQALMTPAGGELIENLD